MTKERLRSVGAIPAGLVAILVLSNGTDAMLEATGAFLRRGAAGAGFRHDVDGRARARLPWRLYGGGYVTAALASSRPMRHAVILGIVLGALGGLAGDLVLGGTQFRFSEAYLRDARTLLGITEGVEVDTQKLEREQPDFVAYLREAHGHVYGWEYWRTYINQPASLWLTPLRYTSEDLAAITDPVLILTGERVGALALDFLLRHQGSTGRGRGR